MEALLVTVSMPPRSLSPNARVHWAVKMKATRKARTEAWAACQVAMHEQNTKGGWKAGACKVVWYARTNARRDRDNCLAMLKPTFDGLVAGGVLVDDCGLIHLPMAMQVDSKNPRVELHLRETDGSETPLL